MIDRLHNAPNGARLVTYEPGDEEFELMCRAFIQKQLNPEMWRYVISAVGGNVPGLIVHYFAQPNGKIWMAITEQDLRPAQ